MSTYISTVLGCLTAMAIWAYAKELKGRYRRRERLWGKDDDFWESW